MPEPRIEITKKYLRLYSYFDRDLIAQYKKIGMRWSPANKFWWGKITKIFIDSFLIVHPQFHDELKQYASKSFNFSQQTLSGYLKDHQRNSEALNHSRWGIWHDIGTGKSILAIELIKQRDVKTLIVCPLSIIETTWMELIGEFAPELLDHAVNLWVLKKKNSRAGKMEFQEELKNCKIGIINFESFRVIQPDLEAAGFKMLIIDESSCIKSHNSKITKALTGFSEDMDFAYPMSGNPAPNSEQEYWAQTQIIKPMVFGKSFYAFRTKYFESYGYGNFNWRMKEEKYKEFLSKLASISEVVRKEDVLDLPEKTDNVRRVFLTPAERKAYEEMEEHFVIEFGDQEIIAANAAVKLMKLREGTSGFYLDQDKNVFQVGESKINETKKLLEEIGHHQLIIWTHFHHEADQIEKLFHQMSKQRPITWRRIDGTIKGQEIKNKSIQEFKMSDVQYLVAHPGSLSRGQNLHNCSYMLFFSLSHSYDYFDQCSGRIYRDGQKNKCSYYYLVAENSVDEGILRALKKKENVVMSVFNYIKKKRGY